MQTPLNSITNIFTPTGVVNFIEFVVFAIMLIYSFIAFILTRQVKLMNRSFKTPMAPYFTSLALVHFIASSLITFITLLAI